MYDKWTCKKLDGHTVTVDKAELEKILAEVENLKNDFKAKAELFKVLSIIGNNETLGYVTKFFETTVLLLGRVLEGVPYEKVLEQNRIAEGIEKDKDEVLNSLFDAILNEASEEGDE